MNADERAKLRALADAAMPGPWREDFSCVYGEASEGGEDDPEVAECIDRPDARFIAAARTAVPVLLDEVERLELEARVSVPIADLDDALRQIGEMLAGDGAQALQTVRDLLATLKAHPRGSIVPAVRPEPCWACRGQGHFSRWGKPSREESDRKCLECDGSKVRPCGAGAAAGALLEELASGAARTRELDGKTFTFRGKEDT